VFVDGLILSNLGPVLKDRGQFNFIVECNGNRVFDSKKCELRVWPGDDSVVLDSDRKIPVCGNVKVILLKGSEVLCWLWFHSAYIEQTTLLMKKKEIDKAVGDKQHKIFPADFSITVKFSSEGLPTRNKLDKSSDHADSAPATADAPPQSAEQSTASNSVPILKPDEESEDEPLEDGEDEDNEDDEDDEEVDETNGDVEPPAAVVVPSLSVSSTAQPATVPEVPNKAVDASVSAGTSPRGAAAAGSSSPPPISPRGTGSSEESGQRSRGTTDTTPGGSKKKASVLTRLLH